ncbi:hypothetical protein [Dactylosporangium sp. NPDC005555]|uniref:hypothetical protein n=1 Tax=Dactylosporangium sp. NPDC005555 TaxID=3154889 RepID=UPI0033A9EFED
MPIPIIIYAGIAAAGAVGAAVAARKWRRSLRIAVLGVNDSGKSTLIDFWRGEWVEEGRAHTQAKRNFDRIKTVAGDRRFVFRKLADLSGDESDWAEWKGPAEASAVVLYLVRAVDLVDEERAADLHPDGYGPFTKGWERIEDSAGLIRPWLDGGRAKLCVLTVTWCDQDPRQAELGEDAYRKHLAGQLEPIVLKLGGTGRVRVVAGSLESPASAGALSDRIMDQIVAWERT